MYFTDKFLPHHVWNVFQEKRKQFLEIIFVNNLGREWKQSFIPKRDQLTDNPLDSRREHGEVPEASVVSERKTLPDSIQRVYELVALWIGPMIGAPAMKTLARLDMVTPDFTEVPVTFKLPPPVALLSTAILQEKINAPHETLVESGVFNKETKPDNMGEERVEVLVKMVTPETVKFPDMFIYAPIPTPQATVNAPTEENDEFVVLEIVKVPAGDREDESDKDPEMVSVPAMLMFPPMLTDVVKAAPPDEIKDPVVTLVELAVLVKLTFPEAENDEESVNPPDTFDNSNTTGNAHNAPDEILVESIWLPTNKKPPEVIFLVSLRIELKERIPATVVLPPTTEQLQAVPQHRYSHYQLPRKYTEFDKNNVMIVNSDDLIPSLEETAHGFQMFLERFPKKADEWSSESHNGPEIKGFNMSHFSTLSDQDQYASFEMTSRPITSPMNLPLSQFSNVVMYIPSFTTR
ncbi:hypothetical protein BDK51DRAFT_31565 [Blyttiomyces helicus]|uniref:Uncharacterized protein n=1 Tax=Blyttiomyces helicus TaxID=388810 RepID=A0A4P9WPY0_9FUNG|nr:hypothetical protein BDK51DRAFT_31565 [Blyttiomyces helicus]|eukprot:RKO94203.1 hypothetical protein BDK51DRAFT_31565 [Blyttiomyces helicus]